MNTGARLERLRARLHESELDALVVSNPHNRRYLSGFTGEDDGVDSAGVLIVPAAGDATLVTDGRYAEVAASECATIRIVVRQGKVDPLLVRALADAGARTVGIEAAHMTVARREDLAAVAHEAGADLNLTSTRGLVDALRVIKDAEELAAIEHAVAITDQTFAHLRTYLRPGLTEREVAWEIERTMRLLGAEGLAFASIVASGPNGALPHAVPSDRSLAHGETITIDMGARFAGYCADMTRTVCLGPAPQDVRDAYDAVLAAHQICEDGIRPGLNGREVDALARDVLQARGRGEQYVHGTGHGLGLEIHEDPYLGRAGADSIIEPGMVITVEPGIYVSGWGGIRIEDTVLVTPEGRCVLTRSPKDLELPA